MAGRTATYTKLALDIGNAQIKAESDEGESVFPHALKVMSQAEIENLKLSGELDATPNVYKVKGIYYSVGSRAMRRGTGAALYGEGRYIETYYGVLAAIAMYSVFKTSKKNIYLYGSHTPKDKMYRNDLIQSVKGDWQVENCGVKKIFSVVGANGYEEPVGAYRHATLGDDGQSLRGADYLRKGETLIIDVGGFTVGLAVAVDGKIEYNANGSRVTGILDVLEDFELLIRRNNAKKLKGANSLDQIRLRAALLTGVYDAAGAGQISVKEEAEQACEPLLNEINMLYDQWGGLTTYNGILLAGGGSALLEKRLRNKLQHPRMEVAESNRARMHFGTAMGGMKILRLLESRGQLK